MPDYKTLFAADGEWLFMRIEEFERDGAIGHDVDVVRITDLAASGSVPDADLSKHGAYIAESASWWPIEAVKREDRITVAQSCGYDDGKSWQAQLTPDDTAYLDERRKLCGWDPALAARQGITPEKLDRETHALHIWQAASIEQRAEMLFSYYGGDSVGYGSGEYTTLAEAMHDASVPRSALLDPKDYDDDPRMRDGWGAECTHKYCIADHIWPRERHMKLVAQWMAHHWDHDENEIADSLMAHLDFLAAKYEADEDELPSWYLGYGVFGEEYLTLLPDYPMPPFTA